MERPPPPYDELDLVDGEEKFDDCRVDADGDCRFDAEAPLPALFEFDSRVEAEGAPFPPLFELDSRVDAEGPPPPALFELEGRVDAEAPPPGRFADPLP